MTTFLSVEDLLALVEDLCVGPVRDLGLLDSAAHRPTTVIFGRPAYASVDEQAAALLDSVVRNHALVDGNKRLGWLAVVVFYGLNDIDLDAPDDEAFDLVMSIASGEVPLEVVVAALSGWR